MRRYLPVVGGLLVSAASALGVRADVIAYTEPFPNASTTVQATMTSVGWSAFVGPTAIDSSGSVALGSTVSTNLDNVDGGRGYGARTATNAGDALFLTTEPGSINQTDLTQLSIISSDANTTDTYRFAVQIGGNWFATDTTYAAAAVGSTTFGTTVAPNFSSHNFAFTSAGTAWRNVAFTAGTSLSLGALVSDTSATLPAGAVTAFGLFTTNTGTMRFDNYQISVVPEPGTAALATAVFGGAAFFRRRRVRNTQA